MLSINKNRLILTNWLIYLSSNLATLMPCLVIAYRDHQCNHDSRAPATSLYTIFTGVRILHACSLWHAGGHWHTVRPWHVSWFWHVVFLQCVVWISSFRFDTSDNSDTSLVSDTLFYSATFENATLFDYNTSFDINTWIWSWHVNFSHARYYGQVKNRTKERKTKREHQEGRMKCAIFTGRIYANLFNATFSWLN